MLESPLAKALYVGNGVTTEFPFAFKVWEPTELMVTVQDDKGLYAVVTDWTASITDTGGTVTYQTQDGPLPEGWRLAITRKMPFVQLVDLITGTRFDPAVIERALDIACAERQELFEKVSRCIFFSATEDQENIKTAEEYIAVIQEFYDLATSAMQGAQAAEESARQLNEELRGTLQEAQELEDILAQEAEEAKNAAYDAINSAASIRAMSAEATTIDYPNAATARWDAESKRLFFEIPQGKPGENGKDGADGQDGVGINGKDGADGLPPDHRWDGTILQFQKPDGTWGQGINLQGQVGPQGQAPTIDVIDCGGACDFKLSQISAGTACSFTN